MARTGITKTLGPIHFEDLDPRRFEDLVRELAYDFKDWQSIEATGRGGSDEGFDIRAYEQLEASTVVGDEENSNEEIPHPMEGHIWMFQCKREKKIGPTRVASIISEGVNPKNPPYGYVLAAPANFSKKSYDKFREELRKRGVMEFYLWGRAALEDMLHLPKNDHILFTFFGISLVSKRKSRATEIRAVVSTKNKLFKLLGYSPHHETVLLRDTKDIHYPYKEEYKDFEKHPRWKEYTVVGMHPLGLKVQVRNYFAFYDKIKKEWDYSDALNLVGQEEYHYDPEKREKYYDLRRNIEDFQGFFQKSNQAKYIVNGLVRFDSIVAVDSEGDALYKFPHIYVDFQHDRGPLAGYFQYLELELEKRDQVSLDGLIRVNKFPKTFSKPRFGTIYRDRTISLNERTRTLLKHGMYIIYDCDNRYQFLNPGDVIGVEQTEKSDGKLDMIKITNKRQELARDFLEQRKADPMATSSAEELIGRSLNQDDTITIYEYIIVPEWQLKDK
jgi:hypothetical protein